MFIGCACALLSGLASWCVAFGPSRFEGSEETPPTCRIAPSLVAGEGESLGYGAETTRPPVQLTMMHS
jgi:hypothetical protein